MEQPYISVIVPCYNESQNIVRGVLDEMYTFLSVQPYSFELIISDDASRDESREMVSAWLEGKEHARLLCNEHGGKPFAVWHGIEAAQGQYVLFTDMDQSTSIDQLSLLLPYFERGYQIAIGSRGLDRADFPLYRRLGSRLFGAFRRAFLLRGISDTQCGFKAMRTDVARELFPKLWVIRDSGPASGWRVTAFDVELLHLADRAGYRIAEVTVAWANRDVAENKSKSYLAESREMAEQILRVKYNEWTGYYDRE